MKCKYCEMHNIPHEPFVDSKSLEEHIETVHQPFTIYLGNSEAMGGE